MAIIISKLCSCESVISKEVIGSLPNHSDIYSARSYALQEVLLVHMLTCLGVSFIQRNFHIVRIQNLIEKYLINVFHSTEAVYPVLRTFSSSEDNQESIAQKMMLFQLQNNF